MRRVNTANAATEDRDVRERGHVKNGMARVKDSSVSISLFGAIDSFRALLEKTGRR